MKNKGFANIFLIAGIAIMSVAVAVFGIKYQKDLKLGTSAITLTQLSDTIGTLRTNVNTDLTTLANDTSPTSTNPNTSGYQAANPNMANAIGSLSVMANTQGQIPVNKGGTGNTSSTANGVITGNGTSPFGSVVPSTDGNVLTSNGSTWVSTSTSNLNLNKLLDASSTSANTHSTTASTTLLSVSMATTTMSNLKYSTVKARLWFDNFSQNDPSQLLTIIVELNGTIFASTTYAGGGGPTASNYGYVDVSLSSSPTVNTYFGTMSISFSQQTIITASMVSSTLGIVGNATPTFTIAASSTLNMRIKTYNSASHANTGLNSRYYTVEYITQ